MPSQRPRSFIMAPFRPEPKSAINEKSSSFVKMKRLLMRDLGRSGGHQQFFKSLVVTRIASTKKHGIVIDMNTVASNLHHPLLGPICTAIFQLYQVQNPVLNRAAQLESLKIVKQLKGLGFRVGIQNSKEKPQSIFVRAATRQGAVKVKANPNEIILPEKLKQLKVGFTWARDQWVKIGGKRERPAADLLSLFEGKTFGEGGNSVQVGPKEFLIAEEVADDPRIEKYQRKGYKFQFVPNGHVFDPVLSDILKRKIYTSAQHIDFSVGGIPDKKILAVDPRYLNEHKLGIQMIQQNFGLKVVEVPEEEADRHPANFLPLGNGKVLVDSGAPKFIERLRTAGAIVIPTAVPLNHILSNKGGLHCLFNEH
jgi:hypothetical protein